MAIALAGSAPAAAAWPARPAPAKKPPLVVYDVKAKMAAKKAGAKAKPVVIRLGAAPAARKAAAAKKPAAKATAKAKLAKRAPRTSAKAASKRKPLPAGNRINKAATKRLVAAALK